MRWICRWSDGITPPSNETPKQEKVFVQKRATKSYTRSYLFQKGKSFVAYGRFQFGTNRSQNIWSKVDQKKWCDSTSWEVFQRGNVKVENSLQASYTEPIFLNFTEEFCFWNMTSSETLQGGKKNIRPEKKHPYFSSFSFFWNMHFFFGNLGDFNVNFFGPTTNWGAGKWVWFMPLLAQSCWDFSTNWALGKLRPKR